MNNFIIDKTQLKNAITQYTCWTDLSDSPVGILWVRFALGQNGEKIALALNAMTVYYYKRKKVCTALFDALSQDAKVILSASGSDEGGTKFLENYGFIYNEKINLWIFTRKEG